MPKADCPCSSKFPNMTPDEAAALIPHNALVGFSGFTAAGAAKAVPSAFARRSKEVQAKGGELKMRVLTGASTGAALDGALAEAGALSWRAPYQSAPALRKKINAGEVEFLDLHLSHMPQMMEFGFFGEMDFAVIEATEVTQDGRVYLTTSGGCSPTYLKHAKNVIIEINRYHSSRLTELHDVAMLPKPPMRSPIGINHPLGRIGTPFASVDPKKIVAVVEHEAPDGIGAFDAPDEISERIAGHVMDFLLSERKAGRIPQEFLPLQAGVGNVANAVMAGLGANDEIPPFYMYTEVFQDSQVDLMKSGKLLGASACSLTVSDARLLEMYDNMDFFAPKIVLRPQEFSNNPGVVRRLGVIAINTALEVDIYGHANSTHVCGSQLMNGIGGSGDFMRNAYNSIFVANSVAKGGAISAIVPMCSHVDHNEHTVQIIVTEHGLADLRGLGPLQRAHRIIENCAHPMYRPYLYNYLKTSRKGHIYHNLETCFEMHNNLMKHGHMLGEDAPK